MQKINPVNLTCPITRELFDYPIQLPCCGQSCSRDPLSIWLTSNSTCPICRGDLSDFNVSGAPKNINLASLVEQFINDSKPQNSQNSQNSQRKWTATAYPVIQNQTGIKIAKLVISNPAFQSKELIIPVIDRSGSMAGHPTKQVNFSMENMIRKLIKPELRDRFICECVMYGSTYELAKLSPHITFDNLMNIVTTTNSNGGGTNFSEAFDGIDEVLTSHSDVKKATIVFLTDGDDQSFNLDDNKIYTGIPKLKGIVQNSKIKNIIIHTIGFSESHKFDILDQIRKVGRQDNHPQDGVYKFADPSEDGEILSNKINSIIDVIMTDAGLDFKLSEPKIIHISDDWYDLTNFNSKSIHMIEPEKIEIPLIIHEYSESSSELTMIGKSPHNIMSEWYGHLIDELIKDILKFQNIQTGKTGKTNKTNKTNKTIKSTICLTRELILKRADAIIDSMESNSKNWIPPIERVKKAISMIKSDKLSETEKLKLNDMSSEGKFSTHSNSNQPVESKDSQQNIIVTDLITNTVSESIKSDELDKWNGTRLKSYGQSEDEYVKFCASSNSSFDIIDNISRYTGVSTKGHNLITAAALKGRADVLRNILEYLKSTRNKDEYEKMLNHATNDGYSAMDYAIGCGWWITLGILISEGAKIHANQDELVMMALSWGYSRTLEAAYKNKLITGKRYMKNFNHPYSSININYWINEHMKVGFKEAMEDGILSVVKNHIDNKSSEIPKDFSWRPYMKLFTTDANNHFATDAVEIIELLVKSEIANPAEIIKYDVEIRDGNVLKPIITHETFITTPLFAACEKGNYPVFKCLIDLIKKKITKPDIFMNYINLRNHKGTTALWIACCNNRIEIIQELLTLGADPTIPNFKGDSCLIPCCQKGQETTIDLILSSIPNPLNCVNLIKMKNKNGDTAIHIACRTGKHRILGRLLEALKVHSPLAIVEILNSEATIDGFTPIFGAVEQDRHLCIPIIKKYIINSNKDLIELISKRTSRDNQIIANATILHLASHYNSIQCMKSLLYDIGNIDMLSGNSGIFIIPETGDSILHIAINKNNKEMISLLIKNKVTKHLISVPNKLGKIPTHPLITELSIDNLKDVLEEVPPVQVDKTVSEFGTSLGCFNAHDYIMGNGRRLITNLIISKINPSCMNASNINLNECIGSEIVPPSFWMKYLGMKVDTNAGSNTNVDALINNVNKVRNLDLQNKLLTNTSDIEQHTFQSKKLIRDSNTKCNINKLSDSHSNHSQVTSSGKFSILGIVDKMKNKKIHDVDPSILNEMVIRVIELSATGKITETFTCAHAATMFLYASNQVINDRVNESLINTSRVDDFNPLVKTLYQAIINMPKFKGDTFKMSSFKFDAKSHAVGNTISWNSFMMTDKNWKFIEKPENSFQLIIKSSNGADLTHIGLSGVVFLPDTQFKITNHYKNDPFVLGQENTRKNHIISNNKLCQEPVIVEISDI